MACSGESITTPPMSNSTPSIARTPGIVARARSRSGARRPQPFEVLATGAHGGVIGAERLVEDGERAAIGRGGVGLAALHAVEHRQVVQGHRHVGMLGPQAALLVH